MVQLCLNAIDPRLEGLGSICVALLTVCSVLA